MLILYALHEVIIDSVARILSAITCDVISLNVVTIMHNPCLLYSLCARQKRNTRV